ncbi:hypothetical protein BDZ91DRAFT_713855 [Kalaharituber pfeilii]|nr:hypothetical protein BDZ91DRAFT_713855 [Kalaharituber pfeilii]
MWIVHSLFFFFFSLGKIWGAMAFIFRGFVLFLILFPFSSTLHGGQEWRKRF